MSPSKFESQATGSPTKLSVPNRKLRNQPTNRVHDIEFAAEISTSLIAQVRTLQQLLAEREEDLRAIKVDRSRLEIETESLQQRMKNLDDSENRYKDENWNLETQIHDLIAAQKDAADREKKLTQSLGVLRAEKNATQRELDEIKMNHSKLVEEHAAAVKHHDIELGTAKRNAVMAESERAAMQRKIEDLASQNSELAKAFSTQRGRALDREQLSGMSDEDFDTATDHVTPEHSPPPSPVKNTPRHSMLESETIKTSLQHAQRTIQSLRTNIHREKTEKLELKRMLQDARDDLEKLRADPNAQANRRSRKVDSREFKKAKLGQLGGARSSKSEIYPDDPNWEDHEGTGSPARSPFSSLTSPSPREFSGHIEPIAEFTDHFDTAHETSDAAFESARERATETDDFHTGAEEISDDDAATETETPSRGASRMKRPPVLPMRQASSRYSFHSTASTSNDEEDYTLTPEMRTPTAQQPQKMRLRVSRGALSRRSRQASEEPQLMSSPVTNSSVSGTPQHPAQSLFAELGDFDGSDDESCRGTPGRRSVRSTTPGSVRDRMASPPPELPMMPRIIMVDSGMVTDPVFVQSLPIASESIHDRPSTTQSVVAPAKEDVETSRSLSTFSYSDAAAQHDPDMEEKLAQVPAPILPPTQTLSMSTIGSEHVEPVAECEVVPPPPPALSLSAITSEQVEPVAEREVVPPSPPALSLSAITSEHVEPVAEREVVPPPPPALSLSAITSEHVEPVAEPEMPPPTLKFSTIRSEHLEPVVEPEMAPTPPPTLKFSTIRSEHLEPLAEPEVVPPPAPAFSISQIKFEHVEPVAEPEPPVPEPAALSYSSINTQHVEPLAEPEPLAPVPAPLSFSTIETQHVEPLAEPKPPLPAFAISPIVSQHITPVSPPEPEPVITPLGFSMIQSVNTEPVEVRSPKRNAFILPRDGEAEKELPKTPTQSLGGILGRGKGKGKSAASPVIAEDETRQSPSDSPLSETPESQRPFKEISTNSNVKPARREKIPTSDQSAQTSLTADVIDQLMKAGSRPAVGGHQKSDSFTGSLSNMGTPGTVHIRRSQDSMNSVIRSKGADTGGAATKRPGSAASGRTSLPAVCAASASEP